MAGTIDTTSRVSESVSDLVGGAPCEGDYLAAIARAAKTHPSRDALVTAEGSITYQKLWEDSDALAVFLGRAIGIENTPVPVYGRRSPLMLVCMLACVKSGHSYVPIDDSVPIGRVTDILDQVDSDIVLAVSDLKCPATIGKSAIEAIVSADCGQVSDPAHWVMPWDTFYIIFTSGSTGSPKGVQILRSCLDAFYQWPIALAKTQFAPKTFLNQAPFSFDLSVYELAGALASGGTIYSIENELAADIRELFSRLAHSHVQVWVSTPSFVELCMADPSFKGSLLPQVETFLLCGEPLYAKTAGKLLERFPRASVFNTYGPTESTVAVSACLLDKGIVDAGDPLPVGTPKPGCEIIVCSEDGSICPSGTMGEVYIYGDTVAQGYYGRSDLTAASFGTDENDRRWYRTGDLGIVGKDGLLRVEGRLDSQIKLNGYRIELDDVERSIENCEGVRNAAVVCKHRDGKAMYLAAFVVFEHNDITYAEKKNRTKQLRNELEEVLPHYMIPRKISFVDALPMTKNGKIDRLSLEGSLR